MTYLVGYRQACLPIVGLAGPGHTEENTRAKTKIAKKRRHIHKAHTDTRIAYTISGFFFFFLFHFIFSVVAFQGIIANKRRPLVFFGGFFSRRHSCHFRILHRFLLFIAIGYPEVYPR